MTGISGARDSLVSLAEAQTSEVIGARSLRGENDDDDNDESDLIGSLIAQRYRVIRKLGEGGMGAVYVATHESLGRDVALKIVRGELTQNARHVERFRREAKTLSLLAHKNIVALYDFGESHASSQAGTRVTLWFAMELLRGESLRDRLRACGRFSVDESVRIARDICVALGAAHDQGVLHRDLKPDNVMIVGDDVKLVDFGIAKDLGYDDDGATPLTQTGVVMGTPGYVPREISVDGIHDDKRSDLYALGVTIFEMLTGEVPFTAPTAVGLMMKHANEAPPRVVDLAPHVPHGLSQLVDELLAKDPANRPRSADEVRARLESKDTLRATSEFLAVASAPTVETPRIVPATSLPVVRMELTPVSTLNAPLLASSELRAVRPSLRARTLVVGAALACGVAVAAGVTLARDDDRRSSIAPMMIAPVHEPAYRAVPTPARVEGQAHQETSDVVEKPKVKKPRAKPAASAQPKLLDDEDAAKPKLLD